MPSTTVHVSATTRDELRDLARRLGRPMRAVLEEAVKLYQSRVEREAALPTDDADLDNDPNALAFDRLDRAFRKEHLGDYVAICDGQIVGVAAEKEAVLETAENLVPPRSCLIRQIVDQERVVHFRRPHRFSRSPL